MLTDIEIELIDKLCSDNGWDFWWYAPNTSPTVACSLRFKDVSRDNTTEFDKDSVADIQTFAKAVRETADGYDVDYETYIWLDEEGHGKNGAPYHIREVLKENEAIKAAWNNLADKLAVMAKLLP